MADVLLGLRLLRVLDTAPAGKLTPRESTQRLATNYAQDYFPGVSLSRMRTLLQSECEDSHVFFQRVRDVRMDLAYRGLVGFVSPRGRLEGRWFITQCGHDWLVGIWRGDDTNYEHLQLPPRRADWREQLPIATSTDLSPPQSTIDLVTLEPRAFELLVGDILVRMGWRVTITRYSQDGGIDIDAINPTPIVGGRVLVQCKQRRGTIGVSTVRELYGIVVAHQATKGLLITTGRYSKDAIVFAEHRPVELIDGERLRTLLRHHGYAIVDPNIGG